MKKKNFKFKKESDKYNFNTIIIIIIILIIICFILGVFVLSKKMDTIKHPRGNRGNIGYSGGAGIRGRIGMNGPHGYYGEQGNQGYTGDIGYSGISGTYGSHGLTGESGYRGMSGFSGDIGASGPYGTQGEYGRQGYLGSYGNIGVGGDTGSMGIYGQTGTDGYQGYMGSPGFQGDGGVAGPGGVGGYMGATGLQGYQGYQGGMGMQGMFGDYGNTGMTGAYGNPGAQGYPGMMGMGGMGGGWGDMGWQGMAGMAGMDGMAGMGGAMGGMGFGGNQGGQGSQGGQGDQGEAGEEGDQGDKGDQGKYGDDGPQGSTGGSGVRGPDGVTGLEGLDGEKGTTGTHGTPGVPGENARKGRKGRPGRDGSQGNTGSSGRGGGQGDGGSTGGSGGKGKARAVAHVYKLGGTMKIGGRTDTVWEFDKDFGRCWYWWGTRRWINCYDKNNLWIGNQWSPWWRNRWGKCGYVPIRNWWMPALGNNEENNSYKKPACIDTWRGRYGQTAVDKGYPKFFSKLDFKDDTVGFGNARVFKKVNFRYTSTKEDNKRMGIENYCRYSNYCIGYEIPESGPVKFYRYDPTSALNINTSNTDLFVSDLNKRIHHDPITGLLNADHFYEIDCSNKEIFKVPRTKEPEHVAGHKYEERPYSGPSPPIVIDWSGIDWGCFIFCCFDKNTMFETNRGKLPIYKLKIGDILKNNSVIEGFFKLSSYNQKMYNLNNIIISGNHKIFYKNEVINISEHPDSILIDNYNEPYIYCLNTSNKRIYLQDYELLDWDEIELSDLYILKKYKFIKNINYESIHKNLDGGFHENTKLQLFNNEIIKIKNIKINDILKSGEIIMGIIKIDALKLKYIKKYNINGYEFICGPNIFINDKILGKFTTLNLNGITQQKPMYLYNITTNTGSFIINNIKFMDYYSCIEEILDNNLLKNNTI
jgi:hypothetical protein